MNNFQLIQFDANLLGDYFNARVVARTVAAIQNTPNSPLSRGPSVITPWDLADQNANRTLAGKFNALRGKTDFIDLDSRSILQTQNKDEKALFVLYQALNNLKTIADYAAEPSTPAALLGRLSSQLRGGLGQVQDYIRSAELEKLTLMYGEKAPRVTSGIALGKNDRNITGATLSVNSKTQVIPGLVGNEIFTLNLDETTNNDDIVIDLSQMTNPLNLTNLVSFINQQINAITVLDSNNEPVTQYKTKFTIEEVPGGKFALNILTGAGEKITLTAAQSEPSLYITGSNKNVGSGATETATLTKLRELTNAIPITEFSKQIAGTDQGNPLPPITDANGNIIESDGEVFSTQANATAVDSQGNVYVVGQSEGGFGTQINASAGQDVFLSKFDASGNVLWTRLLGATDQAKAFDLVIDSTDNVYIAGQVNDELLSTDIFSGLDSFVTKFAADGQELWTRQQDTVATDQANSLAIDSAGDVIVIGSIMGNLNTSTTYGGGSDIFVTKLNGATGALTASAQIGGTGTETGEAVAIAADGNILIASREDGRVILRKLDAADPTIELAQYDLGNLEGGNITDIAVDATGSIFLAGTSFNGALSGGTVTNGYNGGGDGFVTKLNDTGTSFTADWTYFLGGTGTDRIEGLSVQGGAVYVAGKTNGTLPGGAKTGATDGFAAKIDAASGAADWIRQFGGATGFNGSSALAFSAEGSSVLTRLGLPTGLYDNRQTRDIETQTSVRAGDYFFISVNGGQAKKITINAGDDFTALAKRIQKLSYRYITVVQIAGPNGPELKIETKDGSTLDIIAGKGGKDALVKLGLQPAKILALEKIAAIGAESLGTDPDNLGGVFALKLLTELALRSKQEASYVSSQLDTALETIKRAFRSLTFDPVKADLLKQAALKKGTVPAYLLKQLSNYQDGLRRLGGAVGTGLTI
ncbi:hypothetical protein MNBD_ALPHA03-421 [hydrothermal vent metagenome]|uniref:Uncharacterized protein n=1 Tax=hydrothermal vent metagenome TaxID=652676 RepID=A0A3B1BF74_9ZZZZ